MNFKIIIAIFAFVILASAYRSIDFRQQNDKMYGSQQEYYFEEQLLDHFIPIPKKTWSQRYFVLPDYFDGEYGPIFLYICGESRCRGMPESRSFTKQLAEEHKGIVISLEHRFYGASQPFGQNGDSYSTENLQYLTHQQGLADLAYFIGYLKEKGVHGIRKDTPIITVGGSYPGAMSAWFRYKYEHLTIGGYSSSGVVQAIEDFQAYDHQIGISTGYSGQYCPQAIRKLNDYVARQLSDPVTNLALKVQFKSEKLADDEFLEMFADIFAGLVQYGNASTLCNNLHNRTIQQQIEYLATQSSDPDSYTVQYLQDTKYNIDNNARQWFFQTCSAFGWFQTAYEKDPMRSTQVDLSYFEKKCQKVFGKEYIPDVPETNLIMGGRDFRVKNLIFTNGGEDPWQHASVVQDEDPMKAFVAMCQGCGHCCDLSTPKATDPVELQFVREQVQKNINKWIDEYRQQLYGENYGKMNFGTQKRIISADLQQFIAKLEKKDQTTVEQMFQKYIKIY